MFITGARSGTVTLWKAKKATKSKKLFKGLPFLAYKNGRIFAARWNECVLELDTNLNQMRKYTAKNKTSVTPVSIDANPDFLVVGWSDGSIVIHDRKENDKARLFWDVVVSFTLITFILLNI